MLQSRYGSERLISTILSAVSSDNLRAGILREFLWTHAAAPSAVYFFYRRLICRSESPSAFAASQTVSTPETARTIAS
jgi:hypothetical protein